MTVAVGRARQTEGVDFIVDIRPQGEHGKFEERMRDIGFANDQSAGAPLCRWIMGFLGSLE